MLRFTRKLHQSYYSRTTVENLAWKKRYSRKPFTAKILQSYCIDTALGCSNTTVGEGKNRGVIGSKIWPYLGRKWPVETFQRRCLCFNTRKPEFSGESKFGGRTPRKRGRMQGEAAPGFSAPQKWSEGGLGGTPRAGPEGRKPGRGAGQSTGRTDARRSCKPGPGTAPGVGHRGSCHPLTACLCSRPRGDGPPRQRRRPPVTVSAGG